MDTCQETYMQISYGMAISQPLYTHAIQLQFLNDTVVANYGYIFDLTIIHTTWGSPPSCTRVIVGHIYISRYRISIQIHHILKDVFKLINNNVFRKIDENKRTRFMVFLFVIRFFTALWNLLVKLSGNLLYIMSLVMPKKNVHIFRRVT